MINFNKSQNDLKKYEEIGFVFPIDVVSHQEINKIRKDFELAEYELRNDPKRLSLLRSYPAQLLPSFDTLIRNDNLIAAASSVLGPNLMVWSSGMFIKEAKSSKIVSWHQDLTYWGLNNAEETTCWVALSSANKESGCMKFIPGSHKTGVIDAGHDLETTSYPLWTLDNDKVLELAERGGCVAPTGPAGSMLMFSSLLVHASPPNISPFGRSIVYLSLCHVDNHIQKFNRDEWIAHRDFTPISKLNDNCLDELISQSLTAAE